MRDRMMRFMMGRYGNDPLNQVLTVAALALMLLSFLWQPLYVLALALLVFTLFRMFSRNIEKRRAEAMAWEGLKGKVVHFFGGAKNRAAGSKTHRYYRCPNCQQQLRVPKGKGRVSIDCPKCHQCFEKKT